MLPLISDHPLLSALVLLVLDILLWRLVSADRTYWKIGGRLLIFSLFSALLFNEGLNPMQPAQWVVDVQRHLAATGLQFSRRLFAARTLKGMIGSETVQRGGTPGRPF